MTLYEWLPTLFAAEHSDEWITGLTGVGGAILGSLVTILWTEWFNKRTRHLDQKERLSAGAFAALHRLNQIYSDMTIVREHLAEGFVTAHEANMPHLCLAVRPINRLNDALTFPTDELRTLMHVGGAELINLVSSMDRSYNVVMNLMDAYRAERPVVLNNMEFKETHGQFTTLTIKESDLARFQAQLAAMDETLEKAHAFAEDIASESFDAIAILIRSPKRPFGPKFKIELKDSEGTEVTLSAAPRDVRNWSIEHMSG